MTFRTHTATVLFFVASCGSGATAKEPADPNAPADLPQYIFFNRIPSYPKGWNQSRPESFTPASLNEVTTAIGTSGNRRLRIGVSGIFSLLEGPLDVQARSLQRLLEASETADVPVLLTFDGQNWWETRSDLWNWWDPALPGFSEANRRNVEWTGWGPEHATRIAWRNWGRQLRVRPAPNIASPKIIAEHMKGFNALMPVLVKWYNRLPADRKYLFGGLKVGWEASINVNAYYYENGNRLATELPADGSKDPDGHDPKNGWTFGCPALGYAAVSTAGIRRSGTLEKSDIEEVVRRYLAQLSRKARSAGLPRHLIFTHQGGVFAPFEQHLSCKPAINDDSIPGYSFYSQDPAEYGTLAADLKAAGREQWAAAEWWRGAADEAGWRRNFEASLRFKQCRFVCVYNWESFRDIPPAIAAVRSLAETPALTPPAAPSPGAKH